MSTVRRWSIVVLLSVGMMIAYFDRVNLSQALASPEVIRALNLNDFDRGQLGSAFFATYALLQIPAGFVVDRFGVKWPYAISFILWSLISAATAGVNAFWQLMGIRMLLGVGEAVVTPASIRWIRFNVSEQQRGLAVGIYMAGTKYGPALGAPLAALLIESYGWRPMFLILGLGGLVWLIPWLLWVRDDDREIEAVQVKLAAKPAVPFGRVFTTPLIYGVIIGTFAYNYFVFFCMTWLPAYFKESRGLSFTGSGTYTMFSFGGMATVAILAGFAADWMIKRGANPVRTRKGFTIAGLLVASTEFLGAFTKSNETALIIAIVSLSGLGLATANYWALTQTLMPGAAIGKIAGVQNFASNAAGFVAPILSGWLKHNTDSYASSLYVVGGLLLTGVASYVFLVREKYSPKL